MMKNNKNNFLKSENIKFDFVKHFLKMMIIPLVLIIVGIIVVSTVNFNLGYDFTGYGNITVISEEYDLNKDKDFKEAKVKIDKILNENKLYSKSYQIIETDFYGNGLVVKFNTKGLTDAELVRLTDSIRTDLVLEFYADSDLSKEELSKLVKVENVGPIDANVYIVGALLSILVASILVACYLMARINVASGFSALIATFISMLIFMSLLAITRTVINTNVIISGIITTLVTLIASAIYFSKIKSVLTEEKFEKVNNSIIANVSIKRLIFPISMVTLFLMLACIIIGAFNFIGVWQVAFGSLLAIISSIFTVVFACPALWSYTHIRKAKKIKEKKNKESEKLTDNILTEETEEEVIRN